MLYTNRTDQLYRARYYQPALGRYISEDPMGYGGGDFNLYGYVWGSPTKWIDPVGLWGWDRDYVSHGLGGLLGLRKDIGAGESWDAFGQGWSAGGLGVVSSVPIVGGRWTKTYYKWGYGADVDCGAYNTGKYAGYTAQVLLLAAGGVGVLQARAYAAETAALDELFAANEAAGNAEMNLLAWQGDMELAADQVAADSVEWMASQQVEQILANQLGDALVRQAVARAVYWQTAATTASFLGF